jgi:hypothetical protein
MGTSTLIVPTQPSIEIIVRVAVNCTILTMVKGMFTRTVMASVVITATDREVTDTMVTADIIIMDAGAVAASTGAVMMFIVGTGMDGTVAAGS